MKPFVPEKLPLSSIRWDSLIALIGESNRAIARYDGILQGLRNPEILLAPLTTQEAVLSSKIEGTRATLGEVLKNDAGEPPRDEEKRIDILEIVNYRRALRLAEEELKHRPFTLNLLLKLHYTLMDSVRGKDKQRGRFRISQNYIGAPNTSIERAAFVPPEPRHLAGALDNWEKYYHAVQPDPLVQLAIVHAQFEIIHPFLDGNGRLGRMLIPLFLFERRLLARPMFYLSAYLDTHRDDYVAGLRGLNQPNNWNLWIEFFLKAVLEQANKNANTAKEILRLYEKHKEKIIQLTRSQFAVPLLDKMFEKPIFQSSSLAHQTGMPSKPMIMQLLGKLKTGGILKVLRQGSGRRAQVLALADLVNLCEGRKVI